MPRGPGVSDELLWTAPLAISRTAPHGVMLMLLMAAWSGAEASGLIEGPILRWTAGVFLGWMVSGS